MHAATQNEGIYGEEEAGCEGGPTDGPGEAAGEMNISAILCTIPTSYYTLYPYTHFRIMPLGTSSPACGVVEPPPTPLAWEEVFAAAA